MEGENLLLLWFWALARKQMIETQLADVQLDCEELESDVADGLGIETAKKALSSVYKLCDTGSAKGRLMLSVSDVTYKSVENLGF